MAKKEKTTTSDPILEEARDRLKACISDEGTERAKMEDDLAFCTLDQWDPNIRRDRENDPNGARPCLTIDKINQYIVQVVNDERQNKPSIKVRPVDDASDVDTAKVFQGLIRHIEDQSNAQVAYLTAGEWAVKVGLGYFRILTEYENEKSSNQKICIKRIPNAFNVYLGPHDMPDGSDAEYGFLFEDMPIEDFKRQYPGKKFAKEDFDDLGDALSWRQEDTIRVCEYFYADYAKLPETELEDGSKRPVTKRTMKWVKLTGAEIIDKRDWPGKYVPIVEVVGRESFVKGKRVLWGLVRPAKDSLRMNNYWMSAITEKIGLAPKVPFIGAEGQFEGRENEWRKANTENRAFLQYKPIDVNGNALPPPQRVAPAPVEAAMIQMTALIERDVKASLGMYKAAVGDTDPQQSGRAILALQRESDTGTLHFSDNLAISIRHAGRILLDLIPKVIDTKRVIRLLEEDGTVNTVQIDPESPQARMMVGVRNIYNLGVGEYDVTITTGPSYNTKRMEAAEAMLKITEGKPEVLQVMGDLMFKSMDWPMADQIAERFKKLLPPALQDPQEGQMPIPPQAAMQMQQMQAALQEAAQRVQELESGERPAMAKVQVQAQEAQAKLQAQMQEQQAELMLQKQKQEAEIALAREKAIAEMQLKEQCCAHDEMMAGRKMEFEHGMKQKEMQMEVDDHEMVVNEKASKDLVPNLMQMLTDAFGRMEELLSQQIQLQQATLQAFERPRSIALSNLQRDASGNIVGANVKPTIQ